MSQVSRIALRRCSQNDFVFVFVIVVVFVFVFVNFFGHVMRFIILLLDCARSKTV